MITLYAFFRPLVKKCLCSGAVFLTLSANAQNYYPAGLGNGNLQLWLTAADPTTLLTTAGTQANNGDFIATWKDKSTRGRMPVNPPAASSRCDSDQSAQWIWRRHFSEQYPVPDRSHRGLPNRRQHRTMLGNSYQYPFSSPANTDFSVRPARLQIPLSCSLYAGPK